jgi:hypothetical protein
MNWLVEIREGAISRAVGSLGETLSRWKGVTLGLTSCRAREERKIAYLRH